VLWLDLFQVLLFTPTRNRECAETALGLKHSNIPRSLYKYQPMKPRVLDNLRKDQMFLRSPETFNDRFDSSLVVTKLLLDAVVKERLRSSLEEWGLGGTVTDTDAEEIVKAPNPAARLDEVVALRTGTAEGEVARKAHTWMQTVVQRAVQDHTRIFSELQRRGMKVTCFSEELRSPLLWGLYADNNRGFCAEYCFADLPNWDPRTRMLFPVIYRPTLFDATAYFDAQISDGQNWNRFFPIIAAIHKLPCWAYEREWRLVLSEGEGPDVTLPAPPLTAIYLGSNMKEKHQRRLRVLAEVKKIPVRKMVPSHTTGTLEPMPVWQP